MRQWVVAVFPANGPLAWTGREWAALSEALVYDNEATAEAAASFLVALAPDPRPHALPRAEERLWTMAGRTVTRTAPPREMRRRMVALVHAYGPIRTTRLGELLDVDLDDLLIAEARRGTVRVEHGICSVV